MSKFYRCFLIAVLVIFVVSACGGGDDKESSDEGSTVKPTATLDSVSEQSTAIPPSEPTPIPPTEAPAAVETPVATETTGESPATATAEPESTGGLTELLNLDSIKTDPDEFTEGSFQSYRLRAQWGIEPKGAGATATLMQVEVAHVSDPLAEEMSFSDGGQGVSSKMIHIGDRLWIETGGQWIEMSGDEVGAFDDMLFSLDTATSGLAGDAKLIGKEKINGVDTLHYAFDESIMGAALGIYSKIKGDVWVTEDGGYTIKYQFTAEDDEASYNWDWEVYDINAPFTIEPPAEAQGARDDIPLMADATDRASFGGMVTYMSASDLQAVVDFYKEEMDAQGWAYVEAGSMVSDQFAMLNFSKEGEMASITLAPEDDGGTQVVIQAGE